MPSATEKVAPEVFRIPLQGKDALNAYLLGGVLVDSGFGMVRKRLFAALDGLEVEAHTITHAHFDHIGCSHLVTAELGVPFLCGEGDADAVEAGELDRVMPESRPIIRWLGRRMAGPSIQVSRRLKDGDEVGGFTVLETPGHTPGHIAFWRAADRVLVLGDVLFHRNPMTFRRGLQEPFSFATFDPAQNRASARKLADLNPNVVCFGHGSPLRDTERFIDFVGSMPAR
jgi:glyoxylase-like metal-dependent hydrolase (beta-lactamase superfamily II)